MARERIHFNPLIIGKGDVALHKGVAHTVDTPPDTNGFVWLVLFPDGRDRKKVPRSTIKIIDQPKKKEAGGENLR
jgi:hypothetical protein